MPTTINPGATYKCVDGDVTRTVLSVDEAAGGGVGVVEGSSDLHEGKVFDGTLASFRAWAEKSSFIGYRPHAVPENAQRMRTVSPLAAATAAQVRRLRALAGGSGGSGGAGRAGRAGVSR